MEFEALTVTTEEDDALTMTADDELKELVVRAMDELDAVTEAVETGTEEFDMGKELADTVVRGAELLVMAVVPF